MDQEIREIRPEGLSCQIKPAQKWPIYQQTEKKRHVRGSLRQTQVVVKHGPHHPPVCLVMCLRKPWGCVWGAGGGDPDEVEAGRGFADLGPLPQMVATQRSREPQLTTSCLKSILS